jgi:hypothetical protein
MEFTEKDKFASINNKLIYSLIPLFIYMLTQQPKSHL